MKKNRIIIVLVFLVMLISLSIVSVAAITGEWITDEWTNKISDNNKYERPSVGEATKDDENYKSEEFYPSEKESSGSANAVEKKWYEYITYTKQELDTYIDYENNTMIKFYDPYDYSYGMIMSVEDTYNIGKNTIDLTKDLDSYVNSGAAITDTYSSANSKTIAFSKSISKTKGSSDSDVVSVEITAGADAVFAKVEEKITSSIGYTSERSNTTSVEVTKEETYEAVYFNKNGSPYQWKIIHYTVYIPIMCEIYVKGNNGVYYLDSVVYLIYATFEGTCRQIIKNGEVYVEDWATGDLVPIVETVDQDGNQRDIWGEFFTEEGLVSAYQNKLLPNN